MEEEPLIAEATNLATAMPRLAASAPRRTMFSLRGWVSPGPSGLSLARLTCGQTRRERRSPSGKVQTSGRTHPAPPSGGRCRRPGARAREFEPRRPPSREQRASRKGVPPRSEEHTSELQSRENLVCRLLLEK